MHRRGVQASVDSLPDYGKTGAAVIGISRDVGRLARQVQG